MHRWSNCSFKSFWIWCQKLGSPNFGQFRPFPFAASLRLRQVWMGAEPFPDLSRDFHSDSSLGHSRTITELPWNHSLVSWLCAQGCCPAERWPVVPVWGQDCSGAGLHPGCLCTLLHSSFPLSWLVSQFRYAASQHATTTVFHCRDGIVLMSSAAFSSKESNLCLIRLVDLDFNARLPCAFY